MQIPWNRLVLGVFVGAFAALFVFSFFILFPPMWNKPIESFDFGQSWVVILILALFGGPITFLAAWFLGVPAAFYANQRGWTGYRHAIAGGSLVGMIVSLFLFGPDIWATIVRRASAEAPGHASVTESFVDDLIVSLEIMAAFMLLGALAGVVARWVALIRYRTVPAQKETNDGLY